MSKFCSKQTRTVRVNRFCLSLWASMAVCIRGSGASEQLGGGWGEHAKHAPLGGFGGMLPQENFRICTLWDWIWSHLEASETKYSHQWS